MGYPRIEVDTLKIKENTKKMVFECKKRHIKVVGVTKLFCGNKKIAKALVDSKVDILGDSRIENLKKLSSFKLPKMLIRLPMISRVKEVVKYSDIALVSEIDSIKRISKEAFKRKKEYKIILMVDLGDLREGIYFEDEIRETIKEILKLKNINLIGIGTNLTCFGGVIPTYSNLSRLVNIKKSIENKFNIRLDTISGGNSGTISLFNKKIPKEINQLRLGASLSLGIGLNDKPIRGLNNDTFKLILEIVKIKYKKEKVIGICIRIDGIKAKDLTPFDKSISVIDVNNDYLFIDFTKAKKRYSVGDKIKFLISYKATLVAMTSKYVYKDIK
ncbi:MAG: alanine/ornithine racemase family PLP-dependent enzyme [Firmicutes bacterium]|nr:alanine/ornithine racemase family PLP-dependent enzyme [Bacillota bacterium]